MTFSETYWTNGLKPLLALPGYKSVVIIDPKVGFFLRFMQFSLLIYAVSDIIVHQHYIRSNVPTARISPEISAENLVGAQENEVERIRQRAFSPCSEPWLSMYNFDRDRYREYLFSGCVARPLEGMAHVLSDEFYIKLTEAKIVTTVIPSPKFNATQEDCARSLNQAGAVCQDRTHRTRFVEYSFVDLSGSVFPGSNGTCRCGMEQDNLMVAPEDVTILIEHKWELVQQSGENVETHIRRKGNSQDVAVFGAGSHVIGSLGEWLKWSGVELDVRVNEEPNDRIFDPHSDLTNQHGDYPFLRLTGIQMGLTFDYYNYAEAPGQKSNVINSGAPVICILTVDPEITWVVQRSQEQILRPWFSGVSIVERHIWTGVHFTYSVGGMISSFDFNELIATFLKFVVLFNICASVALLYARFCMGEKSKFYREIIKEKVSISKMYANYAARVIVASVLFEMIDQDGGGEISKTELYNKMSSVLISQGVDVSEIGSVVEFIVESVNTKQGAGLDEDQLAMNALNALGRVLSTKPRLPTRTKDSENLESEIGKSSPESGKIPCSSRCFSSSEERQSDRAAKQLQEQLEAQAKLFSGEDEGGEEWTINREEFVNVFVGPPCNLKDCIKLIVRKNFQGRYLISDEQAEKYRLIDQRLKEEYEKKRRLAELGITQTRNEDDVGYVLRKGVGTYRNQRLKLKQLRKELKQFRRDVKEMRRLCNEMEELDDSSDEEYGASGLCGLCFA